MQLSPKSAPSGLPLQGSGEGGGGGGGGGLAEHPLIFHHHGVFGYQESARK